LPFTFSSLPIGSYFAKAKGNGGTDSLSGKSDTTVLMPVPSGLKALHITGTKATLKWTPYTCVKFYTVQYRKKGVPPGPKSIPSAIKILLTLQVSHLILNISSR
jgi:hypothetical protein